MTLSQVLRDALTAATSGLYTGVIGFTAGRSSITAFSPAPGGPIFFVYFLGLPLGRPVVRAIPSPTAALNHGRVPGLVGGTDPGGEGR